MRRILAFVVFAAGGVQTVAAQSDEARFQAGAQLVIAASRPLDATDAGLSGRLAWNAAPMLGLEGELAVFPGALGSRAAFSGGRVEGLGGATVGPRLGSIRPFAKLRPGFVTFRRAQEPVVCIAIFPPPLSCTLAAGRTSLALDVGGGIEWFPSSRAFVRAEAGDRAVRYPSSRVDGSGQVRNAPFFGHDFRLAIGGGIRF